jgi:hypothetical protein
MTDQQTPIFAWHFLPDDRRLRFDHVTSSGSFGRPIVTAGMALICDPDRLECCKYGLHASVRAFDALSFARGAIVCRVACSGRVVTDAGGGKIACSRREVLWIADATDTMLAFARWCALQVVHLWDGPPIVREYLETGDESKRDAARRAVQAPQAAAWATTWAAAWTATWVATWATARAATWAAAWAATWAAGAATRYASDANLTEYGDHLDRRLMALAPAGYSETGAHHG